MTEQEREEALVAIAKHYGMAPLFEMIDAVVERISGAVNSVPLDTDPQKAAMSLYAARMKAEGAFAVRNALKNQIQTLKQKGMKK